MKLTFLSLVLMILVGQMASASCHCIGKNNDTGSTVVGGCADAGGFSGIDVTTHARVFGECGIDNLFIGTDYRTGAASSGACVADKDFHYTADGTSAN